jgi:hypothetical protein
MKSEEKRLKEALASDWVEFEVLGTCEVHPLRWDKAEEKRPRAVGLAKLPMTVDQSLFEWACPDSVDS